MIDLHQLTTMPMDELCAKARANPDWFAEVERLVASTVTEDMQRCQIAYYRPANPAAWAVHASTAREVIVVGGNRSTKTTTLLAELVIRATGHLPLAFLDTYPLDKIVGAIRARICCNSLLDTFEPVIFPKLRWDHWSGTTAGEDRGLEPRDATRGHWGLVPHHCLVGGSWEAAYVVKAKTLRVAFCTVCTVLPHATEPPCRGCAHGLPLDLRGTGHTWPASWAGVSTIQMLSYDQDLGVYSGSSLHLVLHDEIPPADIYRENRMRTLDVRGQLVTGFTPPDEAGHHRSDVAWFYDHVYEPGLPGPAKHPHIDSVNLWTDQNMALRPEDVAVIAAGLTEAQRDARLYGRFVHLSGVIYPIFTRVPTPWCLGCGKRTLVVDGSCPTCQRDALTELCHVVPEFDPLPMTWPILFVIDPHPRKPDACGWFAVTPSDDLVMLGELEVQGTSGDVARAVEEREAARRWHPVVRLMDPNIATETNDKLRRGWTIRQEYDRVGLRANLAHDEMTPGINAVTEYLRPDPVSRQPRLVFTEACPKTIQAMGRWSWDEWVRHGDREPKEQVSERFKDWCDLVRYAVMDRPTFHGYQTGRHFEHRRSRRRA